MAKIEVFDPPMCCSTGVCGPSVDPALSTFAADLSWLADQGVVVERHNLSQEPKAFAESDLVRGLLTERGDEALPAVVVDGELRSSGRFPTRAELAEWSLAGSPVDALDPVTAKLLDAESPRPSHPAEATQPADTADSGCCGGQEAAAPRTDSTTEAPVASTGCCGGDELATDTPLAPAASGPSGCCG